MSMIATALRMASKIVVPPVITSPERPCPGHPWPGAPATRSVPTTLHNDTHEHHHQRGQEGGEQAVVPAPAERQQRRQDAERDERPRPVTVSGTQYERGSADTSVTSPATPMQAISRRVKIRPSRPAPSSSASTGPAARRGSAHNLPPHALFSTER